MATSSIEWTELTWNAANPLDAHFRCTHDADGWVFEVGTVEWPHPSEPITIWKRFRRWKGEPNRESLTRARIAAENRFCDRCELCEELLMKGQMFDRKTCQGCATSHFHVCF